MAKTVSSRAGKILVVDDNQDTCWILSEILKGEGYETIVANEGSSALSEIAGRSPDLVLLDLKLPGMDGMRVLEEIKRFDRNLEVIILTAYGDIKDAVRAIKLGATDFVTKPFINKELSKMISSVLSSRCRTKGPVLSNPEIKGGSRQMRLVLDQAMAVAKTNLTAVLQGESGTGKELLARLIHENSQRKGRPFVAIDCGTLPEPLAESELFGHEKGAFTGAEGRKEGQFESASGGTLFLDEVTNLSEQVQAKLLRVIQERKIRRIGGNKDLKIDVRIIAATNIDFLDLVGQGRFRSDLYFRLNEFTIKLPPLRDRAEDIPVLSEHFLREANGELGKDVLGLSDDVVDVFMRYDWQGNVRELRNIVRRAVLLADNDYISMEDLPAEIAERSWGTEKPRERGSLRSVTRAMTENAEREIIKKALADARYNKSKAARILKIDRVTLYSKLKALGID